MIRHNVIPQRKTITKRLPFLLFVIFILSSSVLFCGCATRDTVTNKSIPECYDVVGNLLQNCDEEISDHGRWAVIKDKFCDKTVRVLHLNTGYEEWEEAGCPSSGIEYADYYVYDDTGDNYALLCIGPNDACFEIPLENEQGKFVGREFVAMNGVVLLKNPVSGIYNNDSDNDEINSRRPFYKDQVNKLIESLDYNYFLNLDPEHSIPYAELENKEAVQVPMYYAMENGR